MGLNTEEGPLREAAIFTRAVENVFRKLIRLLLGRMTLTSLQEMIRVVYIEEAEEKLKRERPGKNVPLTKLALLTGLDTRTLNKYQNKKNHDSDKPRDSKFLREITPECTVLDYWSSNSGFADPKTGEPMILPIKGEHPSFESLMGITLATRGITPKSLIERLTESKSVHVDERAQTVRLLRKQFLPLSLQGNFGSLELGLAAVGNLVETVVHNIELKKERTETFFQRSNWTHRLNIAKLGELRKEMRRVMGKAEEDSISILSKFEEDSIGSDQVTTGVGIFYFEEEHGDE